MFLALLSFAGFTWRQVDTTGTKAFVKLQRIKCIKNTLINVVFFLIARLARSDPRNSFVATDSFCRLLKS